MSRKKRLFLLDAFALIFRGYYAFIKNPRINSKGMNTSAIMGFMNSLLDVIKREKPDHLAVCFDKGGSQERTKIFAEYKANRDETPEAIITAVPYIQKILEAMHIPVVIKEGFEADDIIGTLAKQAEKEDYTTFMVTPDKDFAQLVTENIFIYRPARMGNGIEIWGVPEVQEKFEIDRPDQVIDYLGMMGDSVDNIPGLPGVGDKTAKKFLKTFGSMENLLDNLDQVQGKLKEKIETNKDLGILSKKLATIITDVPVQFNAKDYELSSPDMEATNIIFEELEFRRIQENFRKIFAFSIESNPTTSASNTNAPKSTPGSSAQFNLFNPPPGQGTEVSESSRDSQQSVSHKYQWVNSAAGRSLLLEKLLRQSSVCFDTETTGLNALQAELVGVAFSWEQKKGYYLALPEDRAAAQHIIETFRPFFENDQIEKIGHNLKYDLKILLKYEIRVEGPLYDTMIAHYLINPDMRHNMNILAETYLNYSPQSITELIGKKGKNQGSMRDVPLDQQTQYAVEDADITLQLKYHFEKELAEAHTTSLFKKVELPLVQVLTEMEVEGINLNVGFLNELSKTLTADIALLEKNIFEEVGETFNIASPRQLGAILFEKLKLVNKPKKTKTGQYSTAEDILSYLAKEHPIVAMILEWRSLQKLENTYVSALPNDLNPDTQRIHTVYNQAVAATGRLSSNNPNLQNIPIRTRRGQEVRKAFIPRDNNHILMAADYSQIELRIIAALSKDPAMVKAFQNNEDIHAATAAKVFDVPLDEVTREQRINAKTVNFGIVYGVSAFGLSQQTNLNRSESKELIDTYYESYPQLKQYISDQVNFAREHGYVATVLGRRRYLKDINSQNAVVRGAAERNAVNAPIQGSAADIIKLAMIQIHQKIKSENWKSKMILQVHDELVFDVLKSEKEGFEKMVKTEMEKAFDIGLPLLVDMGFGANWLEAH
ncbi:MAG: DNA polymerase I [Flavobacteriaceae bacterium TMED212]|nr:MAG: DNA polymerase I [Flavobacteriaceae bacterium TMED212]